MGRLGRFILRENDLLASINDFFVKIELLPHFKEFDGYGIPPEEPEIVTHVILTLIAPNENTISQTFFENYEEAVSYVEKHLLKCETVEEARNALSLYRLRVDNTSGKGRVS